MNTQRLDSLVIEYTHFYDSLLLLMHLIISANKNSGLAGARAPGPSHLKGWPSLGFQVPFVAL